MIVEGVSLKNCSDFFFDDDFILLSQNPCLSLVVLGNVYGVEEFWNFIRFGASSFSSYQAMVALYPHDRIRHHRFGCPRDEGRNWLPFNGEKSKRKNLHACRMEVVLKASRNPISVILAAGWAWRHSVCKRMR